MSGARGPIDWALIRDRIEAAGRHRSATVADQSAEVERVLADRARALARPPAAAPAEAPLEVVTFSLGGQAFALESRHLAAVARLEQLAPLPGAEPPVFGLTVWRGELLAVLDLGSVLDVPGAAPAAARFLLVVGDGRRAVGVAADGVEERVVLAGGSVRPPAAGRGANGGLIRGITALAVQLLDGERLLGLVEPGTQ